MRRGVHKLYFTLRKSFSEQQRQRTAEAAAANAAALRPALAAAAAARAALLARAPAAQLLHKLGGIPSTVEWARGAAAWEQPCAEAEQWRTEAAAQQRQQRQQQVAGAPPIGAAAARAGQAERWQPAAGAAAAGEASAADSAADSGVGGGRVDIGGAGGSDVEGDEKVDVHSRRPVPAQPLQATRGANNVVGGRKELLQASATCKGRETGAGRGRGRPRCCKQPKGERRGRREGGRWLQAER